MEDWQEWQIRADQVAANLREEFNALETQFFGEGADRTFRSFWPRFRDLKERVRVAPAIKLEDKLDLERRLRNLGSRAYKEQEAAYSQSGDKKSTLLAAIAAFREPAEQAATPRQLRDLRRDLDRVREDFRNENGLVPADRQAVWEAWRDVNQFIWQRLNDLWSANEGVLRDILNRAREQAENGNAGAARQSVGRFFESLRRYEAKQAVMTAMKAEADGIREEAERAEERRTEERLAAHQASFVSPVEGWRAELERNRANLAPLQAEVAELERRFQETDSLLEQAMVRGNLVDKRRKASELERSVRALEQRIEQAEESPLISTG